MRAKTWLFVAALAVFGPLSLSGCGGGGSGSTAATSNSTGGTAAASDPVTGVSRGEITAVGKSTITVNGVIFDISKATITKDDPSTSTVLKTGMIVTVRGQFNDALRGTASEVKVADDLRGPVAAFNNLSSTVTVLGQRVRFDAAQTVFDNFSGGAPTFAAGQMVRVNGFFDTKGSVRATFIQRQLPDWTPATVVAIRGAVGSTPSAGSFTIGGLTVNGPLPSGTTVGSFVKATGAIPALDSTTLTATSVVAVTVGLQNEGKDGAQAEAEGFVSNLSGTTFTVDGTPVDAGTLSLAGIANGTKVEVEGILQNGALLATKVTASDQFYTQANLVSNIPGVAVTTDANLVNSWGIVRPPNGPWWVNDNATGVATLYNGQGQPFPVGAPLVVTIPTVPGGTTPANPTGIVFNNFSGFNVAAGQPARFIFVTEDGTISAWNSGTTATLKFNNFSTAGGAVYKGAALATNGTANFLYVANFRGASIDVFDSNFAPVTKAAGAFTDPTIPAGYAPFNIANIGGKLFVAYALQDSAKHDDVAGQGHGFVVEYDPAGTLLMRLQNGLWFNSPWGMVRAPADFGKFSDLLVVGNFGSGQIAAFDPNSGQFMGLFRDSFDDPIAISGLWGLGFGNGGTAGPTNTLFFAAGLNGESDGLFGTLTPFRVAQ